MTRDELIGLKHRGVTDGWKVDKGYKTTLTNACVPYPFVSTGSGKVSFGVVTVFAMEKVEGTEEKCHSVVLACTGSDDFFVWCGDAFLEGRIKKGLTWEARVSAAVEYAAADSRTDARSAMLALHGSAPEEQRLQLLVGVEQGRALQARQHAAAEP